MHLVRKYNPFKGRGIGSDSSPNSSTARRANAAASDDGSAAASNLLVVPVSASTTTGSGSGNDAATAMTGCVGKRSKSVAAEKELQHLSCKIDKLLANLDDSGRDDAIFANGDECVICLSAKASMQTQPCGHRVVCRLCFVKTIQAAVAQRTLPLRCVVCRTKILKLKQTTVPPPPLAHTSRSSLLPQSSTPSCRKATATGTSVGLLFRPSRSRSSIPGAGRSGSSSIAPVTSGRLPSAAVSAAASASSNVGSVAAASTSSPRHHPTPTKLIQPLLIYPASAVPQHPPPVSLPSTAPPTVVAMAGHSMHCGHHRALTNHQHHHPHHSNHCTHHTLQQQQQPPSASTVASQRQVMTAWSVDDAMFSPPSASSFGGCAAGGASTLPYCGGDRVYRLTAAYGGTGSVTDSPQSTVLTRRPAVTRAMSISSSARTLIPSLSPAGAGLVAGNETKLQNRKRN